MFLVYLRWLVRVPVTVQYYLYWFKLAMKLKTAEKREKEPFFHRRDDRSMMHANCEPAGLEK